MTQIKTAPSQPVLANPVSALPTGDQLDKMLNLLATPYSVNLGEREAMQERLYLAVLTVSSFPGTPRASSGSSWVAHVNDRLDDDGVLKADNDLKAIERFQPSARDIDTWMDTMDLLAGFHMPAAQRAWKRVREAQREAESLEARRDGVIKGSVMCAEYRRATVVNDLGTKITAAYRHQRAVTEVAQSYESLQRKAVGALKGAARFWWLASPVIGLSKWEYAAKVAGLSNKLEARKLHDEAVLWCVAASKVKAGVI